MPISANSACTCSSVALNERFPTYNFFTAVLPVPASMGHISATEECKPCSCPGRKSRLPQTGQDVPRNERASCGNYPPQSTTPSSEKGIKPIGAERARSLDRPTLGNRWYDAPKLSGDFHAWNHDGFSTHARTYSRACGKALWTGGNRFAPARPNDRAHELWRDLSARAAAGSRAGVGRTWSRR